MSKARSRWGTAAIQNIMILVGYVKEPGTAISLAIQKAKEKWLNIPEASLGMINSKGCFPWAGGVVVVVP